MSVRRLPLLSRCHVVTLSHCHIVTLSHCHVVALSCCHVCHVCHVCPVVTFVLLSCCRLAKMLSNFSCFPLRIRVHVSRHVPPVTLHPTLYQGRLWPQIVIKHDLLVCGDATGGQHTNDGHAAGQGRWVGPRPMVRGVPLLGTNTGHVLLLPPLFGFRGNLLEKNGPRHHVGPILPGGWVVEQVPHGKSIEHTTH